MKRVNLFWVFILVCLCTNVTTQMARAQASKTEREAARTEAVRRFVEAKHYVFHPQSVMPLKGRVIQLSLGYTFSVSPDTVTSDLPYYGQAYQAPLSALDAGIKFTSTDFEYTAKNRKKGGWDITIKPKDAVNNPQVYLTISTSGSASLRVSSTNRDSISFNGHIEETKNK